MKTPQQLIDLPAYGDAERELRKSKRWQHLLNDTDRVEFIANNVSQMNYVDDPKWIFYTEDEECKADIEHFHTDLEISASRFYSHALEGNT